MTPPRSLPQRGTRHRIAAPIANDPLLGRPAIELVRQQLSSAKFM